jgi:lipopolysaccharide biosynthesis regulator YciM
MAPNEEPDTPDPRVSSHSSSDETPARPDPQRNEQVRTPPPLVNIISRLITVSAPIVQSQKADNTSAFSHPGAKIIAQRAADGDGPYRCRKCGDAVLTVTVKQCPGCLDKYPWLAPADDEEHA